MELDTDAIAVSIEEAGRLLGFKRAYAYQVFTTGEVPGLIHVGKNKRVSVEVLRTWVRREAERANGRGIGISGIDSGAV